MTRLYKLETLIVALFLISLTTTGVNFLFKRKVVIQPKDEAWSIAVRADDVHGDDSRAENISDEKHYAMNFTLADDNANPFASLIFIPPGQQRLNLDWVETVKIKTHFEGDQRHSFVFQFRNFDPKYYDTTDHSSEKYVEAAFDSNEASRELVFRREQFTVPAWWIAQQEALPEDSLPVIDAVSAIDISTSSAAREGGGSLFVRKIELTGHWLPPVVLYQSLLAGWMLAFLVVLVVRLFAAQRKIREQDTQAKELIFLNETLELKGKELKEMAHRDALTGVLNRRGVRDAIFETVQQLNQQQTPFVVIMLDIDHFKKVNDTLGHDHGDEVLIKVTQLVENRLRASDHLVRWGGEEFLILCRNTNRNQGRILAESLRKSIEKSDAGVTCSFGLKEAQAGIDFKQTLAEADQALYKAKEDGRNKVLTA